MDQHCQSNINKHQNPNQLQNRSSGNNPQFPNINNYVYDRCLQNNQLKCPPAEYQLRNGYACMQSPPVYMQPCYPVYESPISRCPPIHDSNAFYPNQQYCSNGVVSPYPYANQCYTSVDGNVYYNRVVPVPIRNTRANDNSIGHLIKSFIIVIAILISICYLIS